LLRLGRQLVNRDLREWVSGFRGVQHRRVESIPLKSARRVSEVPSPPPAWSAGRAGGTHRVPQPSRLPEDTAGRFELSRSGCPESGRAERGGNVLSRRVKLSRLLHQPENDPPAESA